MNILIITNITLPAVDAGRLEKIEALAGPGGSVTVVSTERDAMAAAPHADVILGSPSAEVFGRATRVKWIQATASGIDFMLYPKLVDGDIVLTSEKGLVGTHLADHAMGLLLALTRRIAAAIRDGAASWENRLGYRVEQIELEGLTMGIVGFGGTGRETAKRAAAFGMKVRAVDRDPVPGTREVPRVEGLDRLRDMLSASDVVAICVPLTRETRNMFDAPLFACMKRGAILLNVTRGEVMDHAALVAALRSGQLAGLGADVHHLEPLPPDDVLWTLPNVVMTPHTAGASQFRAVRNLDRFIENLRRHLAGEPLLGLVDKRLGY
jgi:phosphoglycerate dehydrogenase-like enzyme